MPYRLGCAHRNDLWFSFKGKTSKFSEHTFLFQTGFKNMHHAFSAYHVADLYGVETREVNQAVKNNPEKFPEGYIFELNKQEKEEVVKNFDNLGRILYSPTNPKAFTERGLYMLATILKSPKATETTLAIVEAYAKLKELSRVIVEIPQHEDKSTEQQVLLHRGGQLVEDIMSDILPKQSSETSFELNLAMFKFKHSVKRENDDEIKQLKEKLAKLEKKINP